MPRTKCKPPWADASCALAWSGCYATAPAHRLPKFKSLPIITLTAKAMKGDRYKCIATGASDCITKPVNVAQPLALVQIVYLYVRVRA